jgi:hypothetical protein
MQVCADFSGSLFSNTCAKHYGPEQPAFSAQSAQAELTCLFTQTVWHWRWNASERFVERPACASEITPKECQTHQGRKTIPRRRCLTT